VAAALLLLAALPVMAQQIAGVPGSPSATTVIDGKQHEVDRPKLKEEDVKKLENAEATAVDGKPIHHLQHGPQ
jgi:hypothetical protein